MKAEERLDALLAQERRESVLEFVLTAAITGTFGGALVGMWIWGPWWLKSILACVGVISFIGLKIYAGSRRNSR
jgi:hypothetical protein